MRHILETSKMQTNGYFSTFFVVQRNETVRKLCEKFEIATLIEPLRKPDRETLGQFTTPYHKGAQRLSIPRIHCRPSSLPEFLLERSNHHLFEFLSNRQSLLQSHENNFPSAALRSKKKFCTTRSSFEIHFPVRHPLLSWNFVFSTVVIEHYLLHSYLLNALVQVA